MPARDSEIVAPVTAKGSSSYEEQAKEPAVGQKSF